MIDVVEHALIKKASGPIEKNSASEVVYVAKDLPATIDSQAVIFSSLSNRNFRRVWNVERF